MSADVFFDTNILIYSIASDELKAGLAEELLRRGGVVSVQTLNEFVAVARRKLKMSWEEVEVALDSVKALVSEPVPLTARTHEAALSIASKYGYEIYDALVIAAALEAKCRILYSEDLQDGQRIEGLLTVKNPFRNRPS